jgi:tetratricopeptide (TPR) repeat protein
MSDPLRTDPASDEQAGADRDAKIDQLLLLGLDHYFDGQYDQAINVWTRALFLDRGHARARAYIERARSALAEHQRESEELLQRGLAAFDRGASSEARRLLERAIASGAPRDEALAVLDRIRRLDAAGLPVQAEPLPHAPGAHSSRSAGAGLRMTGVVAWAGLSICTLVMFLVAAGAIPVEWLLSRARPGPVVVPVAAPVTNDPGLAVPRRGARALAEARGLADRGRLRDALIRLDEITLTDLERDAADRLRSEIQRQLLAVAQAGRVRSPVTPDVIPPDAPPQ